MFFDGIVRHADAVPAKIPGLLKARRGIEQMAQGDFDNFGHFTWVWRENGAPAIAVPGHEWVDLKI